MGLNFRGEANRLGKRNQHGFQEKSAPGPRRGVGGDQPGSLARAEKRFGKITSPTKIKKNFYGGEAYFQDGYSGDLGKSRPITQKSRSPLKINESLVAGAANVNKKFTDIGAAVSDGFKDSSPEPVAADLSYKETDKDPTVKDSNKNKGTSFTPTKTGSMFSKFL